MKVALGSSKGSTTSPPPLPLRQFNPVLEGLPDAFFMNEDRGSEETCLGLQAV